MLSNAELAEKILKEKNKRGGYISDNSDDSSDSDEYTSSPKYDLDYFGGKVFFDEILQNEKELFSTTDDDSNILGGEDIYSTNAQEIINEALSDSEDIVGGEDFSPDIISDDTSSDAEIYSAGAEDDEYKCECCDECTCEYKDGIKLNKEKCLCLCIECLGNKEQQIVSGCCDTCTNDKEIAGGCDKCVLVKHNVTPNIDESNAEDGKLIGGYISEDSNEVSLNIENKEQLDEEFNYKEAGYISNDISSNSDSNDSDSDSSSSSSSSNGSNLDMMIEENKAMEGGYMSDDSETSHSRKIEMFDVLESKLPIIPHSIEK